MKTPKTNNLGHSRRPIAFKTILKKDSYAFRAQIIKRFMSKPEFKNFVKRYDESRARREYKPTNKEIKYFHLYQQGKFTIETLQKKLHLKTIGATYVKIGKIFEYTKRK